MGHGWKAPPLITIRLRSHLHVLRVAELVRAEERGRERHYSIDARPLGEVHREWLNRFAPLWEESLDRLKRQVEGDG